MSKPRAIGVECATTGGEIVSFSAAKEVRRQGTHAHACAPRLTLPSLPTRSSSHVVRSPRLSYCNYPVSARQSYSTS